MPLGFLSLSLCLFLLSRRSTAARGSLCCVVLMLFIKICYFKIPSSFSSCVLLVFLLRSGVLRRRQVSLSVYLPSSPHPPPYSNFIAHPRLPPPSTSLLRFRLVTPLHRLTSLTSSIPSRLFKKIIHYSCLSWLRLFFPFSTNNTIHRDHKLFLC